MKRTCPSIHELLAFEAVSRHLSIAQAADELCVTPSAVSRQISGLERFVGIRLLARHGRRFTLTHAGRLYLQRIQPALLALENATLDLIDGPQGGGTLSLASVPTFTTKWLIPRLSDFSRLHPGITLAFHWHVSGKQAQPIDVDVAIRYGNGVWPGVVSESITLRRFLLVGPPQGVDGVAPPRNPADLARQTVLQHQGEPSLWTEWAQIMQVPDLVPRPGPRFEHFGSLIRAVEAGMGYALVPVCLIEEELEQGRVAEPFPSAAILAQGHYLCYRPEQLESPVFEAFRSWILEEGARRRM